MWEQAAFSDVVQSYGSGTSGLPQSEWTERGRFPVIGQGSEFIEGWTDREDLLLTPKSAVVLYGGHTRRAKYVDRPFVPGPNVKILEPEERLDPKFLFYFLTQLRIESRGYADHFPEVRRCLVPVPPLAEQRRIAAILDKAGALRAKRREAIAKLDRLLQSVFSEMFGDPIKNPMGWKKERMERLMSISRGASPRPIEKFLGGENHWIKIGDATKGDDIYISDTKDRITSDGLSKTTRLKSGSLIFANCGVSLGFARILKIDGCIHDGWLAFQDIDESRLDQIFLLKALNFVTDYFRSMAPDGTQPNLNTRIMKNFELIIPPLALQKEFSEIVLDVRKRRALFVSAENVSENLFSSIQHSAFSIEI